MSEEDLRLTRNDSTKLKRPCVAIYRPPGLRTAQTTTNPRVAQEPEKPTVERKEVDQGSNASSESRSSTTTDARVKPKDLHRTQSKSVKETKKRTLTQREIEEIESTLKHLEFSTDRTKIDKFLEENMENAEVAETLAHCLARHAIEEKRRDQRQVSRLCSLLFDCPSGLAFQRGIVNSIRQYLDCRSQLRSSHARIWIDFIKFTAELIASDVYSHTHQDEIVDILFEIYGYLLKSPILETLKIEELESMITSLLQIGYDLERNRSDKVVELKETIRNALLELKEPWARKMILLLMELCASSYSLPSDANEYYFQ